MTRAPEPDEPVDARTGPVALPAGTAATGGAAGPRDLVADAVESGAVGSGEVEYGEDGSGDLAPHDVEPDGTAADEQRHDVPSDEAAWERAARAAALEVPERDDRAQDDAHAGAQGDDSPAGALGDETAPPTRLVPRVDPAPLVTDDEPARAADGAQDTAARRGDDTPEAAADALPKPALPPGVDPWEASAPGARLSWPPLELPGRPDVVDPASDDDPDALLDHGAADPGLGEVTPPHDRHEPEPDAVGTPDPGPHVGHALDAGGPPARADEHDAEAPDIAPAPDPDPGDTQPHGPSQDDAAPHDPHPAAEHASDLLSDDAQRDPSAPVSPLSDASVDEREPEPAAAAPTRAAEPAAPAPAPAGAETPEAWRTLGRSLRPRANRAQVLAGLLCGMLGFAVVVQVRQTHDEGLSTLRQSELVGILDQTTRQGDELEREADSLERTRQKLLTGSTSSQAALDAAMSSAATQGILAGRLPAEGPGLTITVTDPDGVVAARSLLNLLEELRNAGAEAVQLNDLRITASSYVVEGEGRGVVVDGVGVEPPYRWLVIGDPATMGNAMEIPGGAFATIRNDGGRPTAVQQDELSISATRTVPEPRFATPLAPEEG